MNRFEIRIKLKWIEIRNRLEWFEIRIELKSIWNEIKTNLYWKIPSWFEFEKEVEIVLKTNLKRFIKYVLKGNRRNIYNIYIYILYI